MNKLRAIVIDDSAFNRETIIEILRSHPNFEVIASAADGEVGLKLVMTLKPDIVTLDLEMPKMDGFAFLRILMAQMPTPVLVVSSHSRAQDVFQSLELGAVDFVAKPAHFFPGEVNLELREEILCKAEAAAHAKTLLRPWLTHEEPVELPEVPDEDRDAVLVRRLACIGASTGGPGAIQALVAALPPGGSTAYLIAQHMPASFTRVFAERLNRITRVEVVEGADGMLVRPGCVYIAPGQNHMELGADGAERWVLRLRKADEGELGSPSVDRLFTSVGDVFGGPLLGVILTGMGNDGATGIESLKAVGAYTLAESRDTAIVFGMPQAAIKTGSVDEVLPVDMLIERIVGYAQGRGSRAED